MPRLKRGMTNEYAAAFSRHDMPESCSTISPPNNERAQGRPGAGRTRGPRAAKKHAAEPQVRAETTGLPCASGFNDLYVLSPVRRAFWPPSLV
jgi:hypothetical protein